MVSIEVGEGLPELVALPLEVPGAVMLAVTETGNAENVDVKLKVGLPDDVDVGCPDAE